MKRILSAILLATFGFLVSCNDDEKEPDYPIEPYIESADLKFAKGLGLIIPDTLHLSFYFRDGDMDLGLDYRIRSDYDYPYHPVNYFLENNGTLSMIPTKYIGSYSFLDIPSDQHGKLVTPRIKKKDGYNFLPEYVFPFICTSYSFDSVFVLESNKEVFDETFDPIKSIVNPQGYQLLDTFYYERNENHYNITVDFLVKQPDDTFVEFDWIKEFCSTYDGRFPHIEGIKRGKTIVDGPFKIKGYSTKDGEFRYSMASSAFKFLLAGETIKVRVQIKDHALHKSNILESNEIQIL